MSFDFDCLTLLPLLEMDLLKRNNLFPPLLTIINNIKGYLNIRYGLELLIPNMGQGLAMVTYGKN